MAIEMKFSLAEGKYKWDGNEMRRNLAFLRNRKEASVARTVLCRAPICDKMRNLNQILNMCIISFSRNPYYIKKKKSTELENMHSNIVNLHSGSILTELNKI